MVEWPKSIAVKDVRSSIELAGFYQRFIRKFSQKARPLTDLSQIFPKNRSNSYHTDVRGVDEGLIKIWHAQYRGYHKALLQLLESGLLS